MLVSMGRELMDRIRERTYTMIKSIARRSEFEPHDTDPVPVLYQLSSKDSVEKLYKKIEMTTGTYKTVKP